MREEIDSFTVHNAFIIPWYGENISFTMTVPIAGWTHCVLLQINVILVKECEESNSPTPRE